MSEHDSPELNETWEQGAVAGLSWDENRESEFTTPNPYRSHNASICWECGGKGDAFDREADDWVTPRQDCPSCKPPTNLTGQESSMSIPNEAVEAVAKVIHENGPYGPDRWESLGESTPARFQALEAALAALEAAAPHLMAKAWDECADHPSRPDKALNPFRVTDFITPNPYRRHT